MILGQVSRDTFLWVLHLLKCRHGMMQKKTKKGPHNVRPFLCQMLVSQNQNVAGAGKRMITIANRKAVSNRHPHR